MSKPSHTTAQLQIVDDQERLLGSIGPWPVGPHLQEVTELVALAAQQGLAVCILRLHDPSPNGRVYWAQALHSTAGLALNPPLALVQPDHHLRLPYARAGGVIADVRWAAQQLEQLGDPLSGWPRQQRSWNLSCVHQVRLRSGAVSWLKVVPPFFGHEADMLQRVAAANCGVQVPRLMAADRQGRLLMANAPGDLMWQCTLTDWLEVVRSWVVAQQQLAQRVEQFVDCGVVDLRPPSLIDKLTNLLRRADVRNCLLVEEVVQLESLLHWLVGAVQELVACGLPQTLVHGDLHRGNVIASADRTTVLDWGDASVGHPFFDVSALGHGWTPKEQGAIQEVVVTQWKRQLPNAKVERALALMEPLSALRRAWIYRNFLDQIEPAEHHYHQDDVPFWIRRALATRHAAA